jgi:hypothetical protein
MNCAEIRTLCINIRTEGVAATLGFTRRPRAGCGEVTREMTYAK